MHVRPEDVVPLVVICFLGIGGITGLVGLIALSYSGRQTPEGIATIVGTVFGALGAMLVQRNMANRAADARDRVTDPVQAEVINDNSNPVPTEPADGGTQ